MGLFTKDIKTFDDLFVHQLKDVYYAEKRIVSALPDMIDKATNADLRAGFEQHLEHRPGVGSQRDDGRAKQLHHLNRPLDAPPDAEKVAEYTLYRGG